MTTPPMSSDTRGVGAVEDFANWLESGGGDNVAFALNQSMCCSGQDCGCRGASVGEYLAYEFREFCKASRLLEQGWMPVDTASTACHVLACRFDDCEWAYAVVASPPPKPFTHWMMLPATPTSNIKDNPDD